MLYTPLPSVTVARMPCSAGDVALTVDARQDVTHLVLDRARQAAGLHTLSQSPEREAGGDHERD